MEVCAICGRALSQDEAGLNYKLVNRAVQRFLCAACLSEHFKIPVGRLGELADTFRENGCTMFPPTRDFPASFADEA